MYLLVRTSADWQKNDTCHLWTTNVSLVSVSRKCQEFWPEKHSWQTIILLTTKKLWNLSLAKCSVWNSRTVVSGTEQSQGNGQFHFFHNYVQKQKLFLSLTCILALPRPCVILSHQVPGTELLHKISMSWGVEVERSKSQGQLYRWCQKMQITNQVRNLYKIYNATVTGKVKLPRDKMIDMAKKYDANHLIQGHTKESKSICPPRQ